MLHDIVHYRDTRHCNIFLCGPSPGPRDGSQISPWREKLIAEMSALWSNGDADPVIGVPEFGDGMTHEQGRAAYPDFDVAAWETEQINRCMVQVFWLDFAIGEKSDPESRPGFDTRLELGLALGAYARRGLYYTRELVIGMPPAGRLPQRGGLARHHLNRLEIPVYTDLAAVAIATISACTVML